MFKKIATLLVAVLAVQSFAQTYKINAKTDKPDAFYEPGEPITFSVQLLRDDTVNPAPKAKLNFKPVAGVKMNYVIQGDGNVHKSGSIVSTLDYITLPPTKLDYPGWIQVRFTVLDENNKRIALPRGASNGVGAMIHPEKLQYFGQEPADFDEFWKKQRAALDKIPINAQLTPVKLWQGAKFKLYDFKLDCAGDMPVRGHVSIPVDAKPKSLPLIVSYQGAGVRNSNRPMRAGAISIDVNAHGILNNQPQEYYDSIRDGKLKGYPHFNKDNKDKIYFLGMYLRVMRTLDFGKSLPEWNGKDIIVHGGSQGGGQSIAAAALDPQVTLLIAGVPALSDHAGSRALPHRRNPGWPRFYYAEKDGSVSEKNLPVAQTAEYFDNVNFAKRIRCETYLSTGFIDNVCVPTSVYVVYNNLPKDVKKHISTTPSAGHNAPMLKGYHRIQEIINDAKKAFEAK